MESSINQKSNNALSVMLCTGASFVKKNSRLVARIVLFDTAGLHLLTRHSRPKRLSLISVALSHINDVIIVPFNYVLFESLLITLFQVS